MHILGDPCHVPAEREGDRVKGLRDMRDTDRLNDRFSDRQIYRRRSAELIARSGLSYCLSDGSLVGSHAGDEFAARFLIENGADVNAASALEKKTALHFAAAHSPAAAAVDSVLPSSELLANMAYTTRQLLRHAANVNAQDTAGK